MDLGWYAICCLEDLAKVESQKHLDELRELDDEGLGVQFFPTLAEAVSALRGELPPEDEARCFARVGWVEA